MQWVRRIMAWFTTPMETETVPRQTPLDRLREREQQWREAHAEKQRWAKLRLNYRAAHKQREPVTLIDGKVHARVGALVLEDKVLASIEAGYAAAEREDRGGVAPREWAAPMTT
jgi:hypothetical protein